jgi:zinc transporter, ZIP family
MGRDEIAGGSLLNVGVVFVVALASALASGLGVFPVMAVRFNERKSMVVSGALAAGFMLGASARLVYEGGRRNGVGTLLGALLGVAFILALVPFEESPRSAAAWSIFSSLPQPLMAVPAYLAVQTFRPLLPAGLGFAAGAMTWMVFTQRFQRPLLRGLGESQPLPW